MHISKHGAVVIGLCCAIIIASYFLYKKQHTQSSQQPAKDTSMVVRIGVGTTTLEAILSTSSQQ